VLIYNSEGFKPANWEDLEGETVSYVEGLGLEPEIGAARTLHPEVRWEPVNVPPASLISQVSDGTLSYAVVSSAGAAVARNIYLNFEVAFPIGGRRDVAWAVAERFPALRDDLDRFLARVKRDGTLGRLTERYVQSDTAFRRIDAGALIDRAPTLLPRLRPIFQDAQVKTGIEWRLLAAIAFQESQWDQSAQSETGVRGIMQITEDTARRLGINDLLDPAQNIVGAARYLRDIKAKLPDRIREPDRTWLALAAYNIGVGHLEDARILAQKQKLNPDIWSDVKKVLPLLASPEYYEQAKLGYARGGMPVAFVDRVRGYYDVLLAQEQPHRPRLTLSVGSTDAAAPVAAPAK
jgi:membrane-bound lytic murein transglycosylase F